jgi:nucleoside diphosphate kinase
VTGNPAGVRQPFSAAGSMRDVLTALPRDDWAAPRDLVKRYGAACDRLAFLLVRPDAVRQGLTSTVLNHTSAAGLRVADAEVVRPHPRLLEEIYRYTQVSLMGAGSRPMWWYLPRYYELGPAIVVLLMSDPGPQTASEILTEIKGPSNPADTKPGQIRYDCGSQNMVMCVVHSSEDTNSALREASLFLGERRVARAIEGAGHGPDVEMAALLTEHRLPPVPRLLPTFHQALALLQLDVLQRPVVSGRAALRAPAEMVASALRARYAGSLADHDYFVRTEGLRSAWRDGGPGFLASLARPDDDELTFLHWSALLDDTISAYSDVALSRLRERGYTIDQWNATVLELGWGFHDLISERTRPADGDSVVAGVRARTAPTTR